jgi:hypothetical protein
MEAARLYPSARRHIPKHNPNTTSVRTLNLIRPFILFAYYLDDGGNSVPPNAGTHLPSYNVPHHRRQ